MLPMQPIDFFVYLAIKTYAVFIILLFIPFIIRTKIHFVGVVLKWKRAWYKMKLSCSLPLSLIPILFHYRIAPLSLKMAQNVYPDENYYTRNNDFGPTHVSSDKPKHYRG